MGYYKTLPLARTMNHKLRRRMNDEVEGTWKAGCHSLNEVSWGAGEKHEKPSEESRWRGWTAPASQYTDLVSPMLLSYAKPAVTRTCPVGGRKFGQHSSCHTTSIRLKCVASCDTAGTGRRVFVAYRLRVMGTGCWGENLDRREMRWQEVGENCIMRSFINCTLLQA
jgi:hypothetical protein